MDFPNIEKTFYFDYTSNFGNRYEGQFTVKCLLSIGEKHSLELEKTRLLGNYTNPTDELIGIAIILSNLRAKVIESPNWWKQSSGGYTIKEEDVLGQLFNKVEEAEIAWKKELMEKAQAAKEAAPTPAPASPT